jgi:hypothetical protein
LNYSIEKFEYRWFQVTATFDQDEDGGTGRLYINGERVIEKSDLGACRASNTQFYIGFSKKEDLYAGQMDEVRLWNFAMTEEQVNATWAKGLSGNESGLYFYFNGEGDPVDRMLDKSPN